LRTDYLSESETQLLETMRKYQTLKGAARELDMNYSTARVRMHQIRQKRMKATNTVNRLNNYSKGNPSLAKLLMQIKRENPTIIEQ